MALAATAMIAPTIMPPMPPRHNPAWNAARSIFLAIRVCCRSSTNSAANSCLRSVNCSHDDRLSLFQRPGDPTRCDTEVRAARPTRDEGCGVRDRCMVDKPARGVRWDNSGQKIDRPRLGTEHHPTEGRKKVDGTQPYISRRLPFGTASRNVLLSTQSWLISARLAN